MNYQQLKTSTCKRCLISKSQPP